MLLQQENSIPLIFDRQRLLCVFKTDKRKEARLKKQRDRTCFCLLSISNQWAPSLKHTSGCKHDTVWKSDSLYVCWTCDCTNPTSVMFPYGCETFAWTLREKPLPSLHIPIPELLFIVFFLNSRGDFMPIEFFSVLDGGCMCTQLPKPCGSPPPHPADEVWPWNWFHSRPPNGCVRLKCVIIKMTPSSITALLLRLGPSHHFERVGGVTCTW